MFKAITFTTILIIYSPLYAFVSFDTAMSGVSMLSGGLDSTVDLLESSTDLMDEISEESSDLGQFTNDINTYNRSIKDMESDMRYLGYSEDEIGLNLQRLGSNKLSLEQKMRALTKSVRNIKKMKAWIAKLSAVSSGGGGSAPDPSNQAILANQQQMLHLEILKQKNSDMNELDQKRTELAFKKSIVVELDRAKIDLINSKEAASKPRTKNWSSSISDLQQKAVRISLCLCVLGCIGLMVSFFRDEGLKTLKAGFLGVVISYLLPSIVTLYSQWLGV